MSPVLGKIRLYVKRRPGFLWRDYSPGDLIRFYAYVIKPRDYRNFNKRKFENYYFSKGITALGYVSDYNWIRLVEVRENHSLKLINLWRARIRELINGQNSNSDQKGFLQAILLGDKTRLSRGVKDDFRGLGIVHLLVVSGLHVAILAFFSWWLIIFIGSILFYKRTQKDLRIFAAIVSLILTWFYIALTGFGLPAIRAGIIASIYLSSILIKRRYDSWDAICLSAIIILFIKPTAFFDLSFQLTYLAVTGIIIAMRFMLKPYGKEGISKKIFRYLINMLIVSIGAFVFIAPILSYHFGKVPIFSPITNLIISPIVTLWIVPVSILSALIVPISITLSGFILGLTLLPIDWVFFLSKFLSRYLNWSVINEELNFYFTLSLYLLIILTIYRGSLWKRLVIALIGLCLLGHGYYMNQRLDMTEVEMAVAFLDVGQGAAVFIRMPDGTVTLIDGGGIKGSS